MTTIMAIIMSATIAVGAAAPIPACPKQTTYYCYDAVGEPSRTVYCLEETEWLLGETTEKTYEMTYEEFANR